MRIFLCAALAVSVLLGLSSKTLAGDLVVIESTAKAYPAGKVLKGGTTVKLGKGAKVTLISDSGKMIPLKGPYSGKPGAKAGKGDPSLTKALAGLLGSKSSGKSAIGAMRSAKRGDPPGAWVVELGRSGTQCVRQGAVAQLWRADAKKAAKLTLKPYPKGKKASVSWKAGADSVAWPAKVAMTDGNKYLARISTSKSATKVTLRVVPKSLPSDVHRVAWMADAGCKKQARRLLASLK